MKKYLSVLFTVIFAAMFVFSATSCTKDDSSEEYDIIGTWEKEFGDDIWGDVEYGNGVGYYQFKKDGSLISIDEDEDGIEVSHFTWKLQGNTLTIRIEDENIEIPFLITDYTKNSMTLSWVLVSFHLKRVPDSTINKYL